MAAVLKPGIIVGEYKIVELAGDGSQSNIYLAEHEPEMHWLIQIEDPHWEPDVPYANVEHFSANNSHWVALPTVGTRMVNLASWVDRLELPFLGWRWAKLGREVGHLHSKGVVLQNTQPLALDRLEFTRDGELSVVQENEGKPDQYTFLAPDAPNAVSAASDVYALGASLQALAGNNLPRGVQNVIQRATDVDAAKRYPDGTAFGEALAQVLPNPNRQKVAPPRPKRSLVQVLAIGSLVMCLGLALCAGIAYAIGQNLLSGYLPTAAAVQAPRLRLTILSWQMLDGCNAQAVVTVADDGQRLTPDDGVTFFAVSPLATINEIDSGQGSDPTSSELDFPLGDFCQAGGALTIGARREDREGTSTVYYYPPDEDIPEHVALFKPGGAQARLNKYTPSYLNFGLARTTGGTGNLKGTIKIKLLQNGVEVNGVRLRALNKLDPLVAILIIDTSKSMTGMALEKSRTAAIHFVEKLNPNDWVCVYRFATEVSEPHVCSTNKESAIGAIEKLTAGGNTSLYDVLVEVGRRHTKRADRQVIILLSDGADNNSKSEFAQALHQIASTNVPVFAIGLVNQDLAPAVLQEIAARTGGEYLEAPGPDDLERLYSELQARFENQYEVEFESIFPESEQGTLELIISDGESEINIKKDYIVQP